jgi:hypothetical protein
MTERSASTLPAARPVYPFTAIVGQETLKDALRLNAVNPRLGGVLIRGEKGTAKSTAVRALGALLPPLRVRARCRFSCDPERPDPGCPDCAGAPAEAATEAFWRPVRLVTLPLGATEDRLLGTLDLEAAIASGTRRFEPGLLAQAHRGLLYVDEVNLLPDFLVDALLDAAAMGVNLVEREGISDRLRGRPPRLSRSLGRGRERRTGPHPARARALVLRPSGGRAGAADRPVVRCRPGRRFARGRGYLQSCSGPRRAGGPRRGDGRGHSGGTPADPAPSPPPPALRRARA